MRKNKGFLIGILCFILLLSAIPSSASQYNTNTDWMSQSKYGIMFHYLPQETKDKNNLTIEQWNERVNSFDVPAFVDEMVGLKVDYVMFTIGQNSGFYCSPNSVYESYAGYNTGEACSTRDLPLEIGQALHKKGIRMIMYLPSNVSAWDKKAANNFGLTTKSGYDWVVNPEFEEKWANVIKEWANRYGEYADAWWFDGFFEWSGFNTSFAEAYSNAVKGGNPNTLVTFNPGIELTTIKKNGHAGDYEDYTAGEIRNLTHPPTTRWYEGIQAHTFSYLGNNWGHTNNKYSDAQLATYILSCNANQNTVTIDMLINQDSNGKNIYDGTFIPNHINQIRRVASLLTENEAHWTMDHTSEDISNNYDGTLHGGASFTDQARIGNGALSLSGENQYMTTESVTQVIDNLHMSAWVQPSQADQTSILLYNGNTSSSGYGLMLYNGKLTLLLGGKVLAQSNEVLPVNEWSHLIGMRKNGEWVIYLNGQQISLSSNATPKAPTDNTLIGANNKGQESFKGLIDDVRIGFGILTDEQIQNLSSGN